MGETGTIFRSLESSTPFTTEDGSRVTLTLRRLGRIRKVDAATALARGDLATAEEILLTTCVKGWSGVADEQGKPVEFTQERLDQLLGNDDALGRAVSNHLFQVNGLAGETKEGPLVLSSSASST